MSQYSKNAFRFNPGDMVLIPKKFLPEVNTMAEYVPAVVSNVCTNHVVFKLKAGYSRSLPHANCAEILMGVPADFKVYGREAAQMDLIKSMEKQIKGE